MGEQTEKRKEGWGKGWESLVHKQEYLRLDPQNQVKPDTVAHICNHNVAITIWEVETGKALQAHRPTSLE